MSPAAASRAAIGAALATPLLMIGSCGISPVVLSLVAGLLAYACWRSGMSRQLLKRGIAGAATPLGVLSLALVLLLAVSLAWTPALKRGGEYVLHVTGSLALLGIAGAGARVLAPKVPAVVAAALIAFAAGVLTLDVALGGGLRDAFGLSTDPFRLNRSALAFALLLPLLTMLLLLERRWGWLALVWVVCRAAIFGSTSESAKLGAIVALVALLLALVAPLATNRLMGMVGVAATIMIPLLAPVINDVIPRAVQEAIGYSTLTLRGEIWREYALMAVERPIFGFGVEAGNVAAHLPEADLLTETRRSLLDYGHPHNAALQIWYELGLVGALVAAALLAALFRAFERHAGALLPAATATAAGAYAVAYVSHGVWQAWWWCLLALIGVLFVAHVSALSASLAAAFPAKPPRSEGASHSLK